MFYTSIPFMFYISILALTSTSKPQYCHIKMLFIPQACCFFRYKVSVFSYIQQKNKVFSDSRRVLGLYFSTFVLSTLQKEGY